MSNGLNKRRPKSEVVDFEKKAAEQRLARQEKCSAAVNEVLENHNCQLAIFVQVGNQAVPLDKVLMLPLQMIVISK